MWFRGFWRQGVFAEGGPGCQGSPVSGMRCWGKLSSSWAPGEQNK